MKWMKVVEKHQIHSKILFSVADHLFVGHVWTKAADADRHLGGVIDDVHGRIQSHNRR